MSSQNLLNTSSWTVGNGSVSGFSQNGATSENSREFGADPFGNSSILWKGGNDAASNADGGWNTSYYAIDHAETYRFTVWLKKTNSTNGHSYVGFHANNSGSLRLNGTYNVNPYFWYGDLPQLNKWYLVVGYVHGSNYNSNLSYGGIYDPAAARILSCGVVNNNKGIMLNPAAVRLNRVVYEAYLGTRKIRAPAGGNMGIYLQNTNHITHLGV